MRQSIGVAAGLAVAGLIAAPLPSWAQAAETALPALPAAPPPGPPPAPPPPPAPTPPVAPPPVVALTPPPAGRDDARESEEEHAFDHDRFVKHLGITYFDITSLPIANTLPVTGGAPTLNPGGITGSTVAAPVVGVRYWVKRAIGIDIGLGLGFAGGSQEAVTGGVATTVPKVGTTGFAFHAGLPLVVYEGRHYAFLVIPELTVGTTSGKFNPGGTPGGAAPAPEQDLSGFLFDGGAKIGAEIYFGFIGLPELALQGTVGLTYRRSVFKLVSGGSSASDGTSTFGTDVGSDPWAIFTNNVSATYYFR